MSSPLMAIEIDRLCPQSDGWRCLAEAAASVETSASCYHVEENIGVAAIVESVLKFREIQRQIFLAHVVVSAENPALEQRLERFHRIGMDFAAHVLAFAMIDGLVR